MNMNVNKDNNLNKSVVGVIPIGDCKLINRDQDYNNNDLNISLYIIQLWFFY